MIDIGPDSDFPESTPVVVTAEGREIGIIRWRGTLFALANSCTHMNGPVCRGIFSPRLTADRPGEMDLDRETPVILCPWHGWEFDIRTGAAIWDSSYRLRTYKVRSAAGRVLIETGRPT